MLKELRQYNVDIGNLEDMVEMHLQGSLILKHFEDLDIDIPEWLPGKLRQIKREIMQKVSDKIEKRLSEARLRLESLKTPIQKKAEIEREIKKLEASLAAVG